jgi:hypothetical protein
VTEATQRGWTEHITPEPPKPVEVRCEMMVQRNRGTGGVSVNVATLADRVADLKALSDDERCEVLSSISVDLAALCAARDQLSAAVAERDTAQAEVARLGEIDTHAESVLDQIHEIVWTNKNRSRLDDLPGLVEAMKSDLTYARETIRKLETRNDGLRLNLDATRETIRALTEERDRARADGWEACRQVAWRRLRGESIRVSAWEQFIPYEPPRSEEGKNVEAAPAVTNVSPADAPQAGTSTRLAPLTDRDKAIVAAVELYVQAPNRQAYAEVTRAIDLPKTPDVRREDSERAGWVEAQRLRYERDDLAGKLRLATEQVEALRVVAEAARLERACRYGNISEYNLGTGAVGDTVLFVHGRMAPARPVTRELWKATETYETLAKERGWT